MRFARKLAAAMWIGICFIFGVNALERFQRESALFAADIERDHTVMGRGLAAAVAEVWADEGKERALSIVERANQRESQVQIRWVDLHMLAPAPDAPSAPLSEIPDVDRGEFDSWIDSSGPGTLFSYVPMRVGPHWTGAIELSESLEPERAYVRASLARIGLWAGVMALLSGGVAMGLGVVFVGRPIRQLAEKAQRVGSGDFSGELTLSQDDELGDLAREMNAMARRLDEARGRVDEEMAARIAALEQLRHAERLLTVGKLAAGIAHEMGTPLNVIQLRAQMVADGSVVEPDGRRDAARVIAEQAERITRIIRQLLDFARRRTPDRVEQDVVSIVERTLVLLRPLARKSDVDPGLVAAVRPLRASVDAVQIQQVISNLVINALHAMRDKGDLTISVTAESIVPPVDVGGPRARFVRVDVQDSGTGIQADDLARVFDPFFTTKDVGEGTGLGLSVAYGIVREHGGWIAVASTPGRGTRFSVFLPAVA